MSEEDVFVTEEEQAVIDALEPAGRDGLKFHAVSTASGLGSRTMGVLQSMLGRAVLSCVEPDWDPASESHLPTTFYYLPKYEVKRQGEPMALPVTARHCDNCMCHVVPTAGMSAARIRSRDQDTILRTLLRKGPMTLGALKQAAFTGEGRLRVGPALDGMAEMGVVKVDSRGVWSLVTG